MSKQITKKEETSIAIKSTKQRGFDDFRQEDLVIPRLQLLQALSNPVTEGKASVGQFQDSLTNEILPDSFELVFLFYKHGAVYFETGKGMICKSNDGFINFKGIECKNCPHNVYYKTFSEDGQPPKCAATLELMAITRDSLKGKEQRPLVVTFKKSSIAIGKKIISMARFSGKDIFAYAYNVSSVKEKSAKGVFANYDIKRGDLLTSEEFLAAENWYNVLLGNNVKIAADEGDLLEDI